MKLKLINKIIRKTFKSAFIFVLIFSWVFQYPIGFSGQGFLSLLNFPASPNYANAEVATLDAWASVYGATAYPGATAASFAVSTTSSNRLLVVAIASSRSTAGTQTMTSVTYGGVAMTLAAGDAGSSAQQHTYIYYLTDNAVMDGTAKTLAISMSGGTDYYTSVFKAVYSGVDTSNPIADSQNVNQLTTTGTSPIVFSPNLNVNAGNLAIKITNGLRTGSGTARTISSIGTNWTSAVTQVTGASGTSAAWRYAVGVFATSSSNTTEDGGTTWSGTCLKSQTGIVISRLSPPGSPSFSDSDGTNQIAFNNIMQSTTTPIFRVSATSSAAFNRFQIEMNTASDFSGTAYTETYSSSYASGTVYNLSATSLSPSLPTTNGATYYVRARASADGGTTYGSWSTSTQTFTYESSGSPAWFQTANAQFNTDTLTGTVASSDQVILLPLMSATGGTITTTGGYRYHSFTSSGTFQVTSGSGNIEALVVAGGGGGGNDPDRTGGGGGAGGVIYNSSYAVTPQSYTVTIGGGGAANTAGSNSVFGTLTAIGGGRGGQQGSTATAGGSGGGGYHNAGDSGKAGTAGQGNSGGNGYDSGDGTNGTFAAGGGGGATQVGANGVATQAGKGGDGYTTSISGSSVTYGGGGGGGLQHLGTGTGNAGAGGAGGGGAGGNTGQSGTAGTVNTGGGGGGAGQNGSGSSDTGGAGGSGIVIVKYPYSTSSTGTIMSSPINFSFVPGSVIWSQATWSETETSGTVSMQVYYGASCSTIIPDGDLSGNSTGFASSPINLSGLSTSTYSTICLKASITSGATLNDWTVTYSSAIIKPNTPTFSNSDGTNQIAFNNIIQSTTTPLFRVSATSPTNFTNFQLQLSTTTNFSGTTYSQTFSSTYASGTVYNLLASSLSPSLPTTNGITYYVRARASADGSNYSNWSTSTQSFTYESSGSPAWFQTTDAQFNTGTLSSATTTGSGSVGVSSSQTLGIVQSTKWEPAVTGTSVPFTLSLQPAVGDLLVAFVGNSDYSLDRTTSAPDGTWTKIQDQTNGTAQLTVWWKIVQGGDGTGYTFPISGTVEWQSGVLYEIQGENSVTPINQSSSNTGTQTSPTVTPSVIGTLALSSMETDDGSAGGLTLSSVSGGWTEDQTARPQYHATYAASRNALTTDTSTGISNTWTLSGSATSPDAATVLINPSSSGSIMSSPINYSFVPGATSWDSASWSKTATSGTVSMQVYYGASCSTIIPDGDLSGNSTGFASSPINLSGLSTSTYSTICLKASITSGATLNDWTVAYKTVTAPNAPVFYNDDGGSNQIAFNNIRQATTTPIFRVSATSSISSNSFQIELNDVSDFTGTAHRETFSGTYTSGTAYNLSAASLSPALSTTDGETYYVRARASNDGGGTYGSWSSGTWTFTYASSSPTGNPDWFQTSSAQFNTGTLSSTQATGSSAVSSTNWYNTSFPYRKLITIDHTKVSSNSASYANFPALISLTDSDLASHAESSGNDIVFTSSNGTTTLPYQRESYSSSTGALNAWVNIPSLSSSADTQIYMYYGSSTAPDQENSTSTWNSNYRAVWHLEENPAGVAPQMKDSTSNANNGTSIGSMLSSAQVPGKIDGSLNFNGTSNSVSAPAVDSSATNAITVSLWLNQSSFGTGDQMAIEGTTNSNLYTTGYFIDPNSSAPCSGYVQISILGDVGYNQACYTRPSAGAWHQYVAVFDKSQAVNEVALYIDGTLQTPTSYPTNTDNTNNFGNVPVYLMSRGGSSFFNSGLLDEVQISNTALSSGWIATEYNDQNSPATFYNSISDPQTLMATGSESLILGSHTVSTYFTDFSGYATGSAPSDWTKRYDSEATSSWLVQSDVTATGSKVLQVGGANSSLRRALSWNLLDNVSPDAEIFFRYKVPSTNDDADVLDRASGATSGAITTLRSGFNQPSNGEQIGYFSSNSFTTLSSSLFTPSTNTWYDARASFEGTNFSYKTWLDSNPEPATWDLTATSSLITAAGWIGIFDFHNDGTGASFDVFGVGLNGASAPTSTAAAGSQGTIISPAIKFNFVPGVASWGGVAVDATTTLNSNIIVQVLDSTQSAISGKTCTIQNGASSCSIDLSDISTTGNNATLYLKATLSDLGGGTPNLNDWEVSWGNGTAALTQLNYRWRLDDSNEVNASYAAATNTALTSGVVIGDRDRLRVQISNTGSNTATNYQYRLEYASPSDSCSTWTAVPSSTSTGPWTMDWSSNVADNSLTTDSAGIADPANKTFVPGYVKTSSNQTPAITLTNSQFTELEYSVRSTSNVVTGSNYCFRVTNAGDASKFTYTVQPQISVAAPVIIKPRGGSNVESGNAPNGSQSGGNFGGGSGTEQSSSTATTTSTTTQNEGGGGGDVGLIKGDSIFMLATAAISGQFTDYIWDFIKKVFTAVF